MSGNAARPVSHDFWAIRRLEEVAERGQSRPAQMLPAPLQFIIAMIAYAINQWMVRRLDYLQEEIRFLKEALAATILAWFRQLAAQKYEPARTGPRLVERLIQPGGLRFCARRWGR
jgi:hypothetical protein